MLYKCSGLRSPSPLPCQEARTHQLFLHPAATGRWASALSAFSPPRVTPPPPRTVPPRLLPALRALLPLGTWCSDIRNRCLLPWAAMFAILGLFQCLTSLKLLLAKDDNTEAGTGRSALRILTEAMSVTSGELRGQGLPRCGAGSVGAVRPFLTFRRPLHSSRVCSRPALGPVLQK